ncbi:SDR family NAD(P)-dependent oxidoreductase [Acuticoccus mangrovi]|uniref:SDR family oxidoreductase n=1 Tax=Acuticoccus mangrovi TaxID=2796142 RepID=A0A934ISQ1_9HYPH|nr:SDR family oxidoreductase [Acuticoccus mangrovi]MBJ3778025.1 SDR family oxidoreductase [Acuticoccus mangrovi]
MLQDVTVVTGGSNGIGRAIVQHLLSRGRAVVNVDRAAETEPSGAHYIEADLSDADTIGRVFDDIAGRFAIVGLVNNAGRAIAHSLEDTTPDDFNRLVPINMVAPTICAQRAARSMKARGWGRIVNIASRAATGKELRTAYGGTKGALLSMTRVWALELAPHNITVNAIGPGPIATELFRAVNPDDSERTQALKRSIPLGRVGSPDDIANAAGFFLAEENGYVTGQTLFVCGGLTIGVAGI